MEVLLEIRRRKLLILLVCLLNRGNCGLGEKLDEHLPAVDDDTLAKEQELADEIRAIRRDILERTYIVAYDGKEEGIKKLADENGFAYRGRIAGNFYELRDNNPVIRVTEEERASRFKEEEKRFAAIDNNFKGLSSDKFANIELTDAPPLTRRKRFTANDKFWSRQWHLHPTHLPTMGVSKVWDLGYSGAGVNVTMADDGIDYTHVDLDDNYLAANSFNFIRGTSDPSHIGYRDGHGTKTAGIVAAERNSECTIGVAFNVRVSGVLIISVVDDATNLQIARGMTYSLQNVHISSNSWGHKTRGSKFREISPVIDAAVLEGAVQGRGGKGIIYVVSAGNGREYGEDCNSDQLTGSIYTITVSSLAPSSRLAFYSEECSAVLVAAYGGDKYEKRIATTKRGSECTSDFEGTSASCPVVSGIIALVLEANGNLTYRDIQHLLVEYSTRKGLHMSHNFYTNGAGKNVSYHSGFGLPNAYAMVNIAPYWRTVPESVSCATPLSTSSQSTSDDIVDYAVVNDCHVNYIENVLLTLEYSCADRGDVEIYLKSPTGNAFSRVFKRRPKDLSSSRTTRTFMSVHFWGESTNGNWTLKLLNTGRWTMNLYAWKLTFHGTSTDPTANRPTDGSTGGHCDKQTPCNYRNDVCYDNMCTRCENGRSIINGTCMKDGQLGGICNEKVLCESWQMIGCDLNTSVCVSCHPGFHGIGGFCIQDGVRGGFCDKYIDCKENGIGCHSDNNTCVQCSDGHRVIDGFCIKDGVLGGFCNSSKDCISETVCSMGNVCMFCGLGHHAIDGYCVQDGTLGGFCNYTTPCTSTGSGCSASTDRCIVCTGNNEVVLGYCVNTECGGVFTDVRSTIKSPGVPNNYNGDCEYVIVVPRGNVSLLFTTFNLDYSPDCTKNSIKVFDGSSTATLGTYCGVYNNSFWVNSTSNVMIVLLSTYSNNTTLNVQANYYTNWNPACGGILYQSSNSVSSPNYPNRYPTSANCTWFIYVDPGSIVRLAFSDFNLESDTSCKLYDYVEVYDGFIRDPNRILLRHCGKSIPRDVYSTSNILTVVFKSDSSGSYTGFAASITTLQMTPGCGGIYDHDIGSITYPNDTSNYSNTECNFYIPNVSFLNTKLIFKRFSLGNAASECYGSYLEIQEVNQGTSVKLGRFCGNAIPSNITSANTLLVRFISSGDMGNLTGFEIIYMRSCEYTFRQMSGRITSPNYPRNYPMNVNCTWTIEVPNGNIIDLNFHNLDIYNSYYSKCLNGYVMVSEGPIIYGRFCGSLNKPRLLSENNTITLNMVTGNYQRTGFNASYVAVDANTVRCGGNVYAEKSELRSPGFPDNKTKDAICIWRFFAPEGSYVYFRIDRISSSQHGCDSFVKVYNNTYAVDEDLQATYCAEVSSDIPLILNSSVLTVKFVVRNNTHRNSFGFQASFKQYKTPNCSHNNFTGQSSGFFTSPGYPSIYPNNIACKYSLNTDVGHVIVLNFTRFSLYYDFGCDDDYVAIYDGDTIAASNLIGKYCSANTRPRLAVSSSNTMTVVFRSNQQHSKTGFIAFFHSIYKNERSCEVYNTSMFGNIQSPAYPAFYQPNELCITYLQAPVGYVIDLWFDTFSLNYDAGCDDDFVVVYDAHFTSEDNLLLRQCSSSTIPRVATTSNTMTIMFVSNWRYERNGFSAYYYFRPKVNQTEQNSSPRWTATPSYTYRSTTPPWTATPSYTYRSTTPPLTATPSYTSKITKPPWTATPSYTSKSATPPWTATPSYTSKSTTPPWTATPSYTSKSTTPPWTATPSYTNRSNTPRQTATPSYTNRSNTPRWTATPNHTYTSTVPHWTASPNRTSGNTSSQWTTPQYHTRFTWPGFLTTNPPQVKGACGGEITGIERRFSSDGYPDKYTKHLVCTWTLSVPAYYVINLTFEHVTLASYGQCSFAGIEVYDLTNKNTQLTSFCENVPESLLSSGRKMAIVFRSNHNYNRGGFLASMTIYSPVGKIHAMTDAAGFINLPLSRQPSPTYESVLWVIAVEPGYVVQLTFLFFKLPSDGSIVKRSLMGTECPNGALFIFNGADVRSDIIGVYCGSTKPSSFVSSSNELTLWYKSVDVAPSGGFSIQYVSKVAGTPQTVSTDPEVKLVTMVIVSAVLGTLVLGLVIVIVIMCIYIRVLHKQSVNDEPVRNGESSNVELALRASRDDLRGKCQDTIGVLKHRETVTGHTGNSVAQENISVYLETNQAKLSPPHPCTLEEGIYANTCNVDQVSIPTDVGEDPVVVPE